MPTITQRLSGFYRRYFPMRRVLVRIEDRLEHVERVLHETQGANINEMRGFRDETIKKLGHASDTIRAARLAPSRLNEIENAVLRRFDEQLLSLQNFQSDQRSFQTASQTFQSEISERLTTLLDTVFKKLEEDAQISTERFDEAKAQTECFAELQESLASMQSDLSASPEKLKLSLSEVVAQIETVQKEILATEVSVSRTLQAHLDSTRSDLGKRIGDAIESIDAASTKFADSTKLQEQELQTILSLQEQLIAKGLDTSFGPKDLPDLRSLALAIEDGEVELDLVQPSLEFMGRTIVFDDLFSVYVVFKEIFLYEDYYADLKNDSPRIIDGGAHIGMAALYFKDRYPAAKVVCFEPDPRNFELLSKNTDHLGTDIERHNLALTASGGSFDLMRREGQSMASSIYSRYSKINNDEGIVIESTKLSEFLTEPVDILKLDIEGAEDSVLEECRHLLSNVCYLFIEFHTGDDLPLSRLRSILEVLDEAEFTYQIERAREYQTRMMHRPFTHLNHLCTHVIHAKNLNWRKQAV